MKTLRLNDYSDNPILLVLENLVGITTAPSSFVDVAYVEVLYVGRTKVAFYARKDRIEALLNTVQDELEAV